MIETIPWSKVAMPTYRLDMSSGIKNKAGHTCCALPMLCWDRILRNAPTAAFPKKWVMKQEVFKSLTNKSDPGQCQTHSVILVLNWRSSPCRCTTGKPYLEYWSTIIKELNRKYLIERRSSHSYKCKRNLIWNRTKKSWLWRRFAARSLRIWATSC